MWDFAASSDPFVRFALVSSLVAVVATAVLFASVVILRLRLIAHRRAEQEFIATWRPLLTEMAIRGIDPETDQRLNETKMPTRDAWHFLLNEWNVLQDSLKGSGRQHLIRAGYKLGLDQMAWTMLKKSRSLGEQLLAVVTLGHLGEISAWNDIVAKLDSKNALLSLMAAKALCNIDPDRAIGMVIDRILSREDWAGARVAGVLLEAGAGAISQPLHDAILAGSPTTQEKLISFLPMVYKAIASHVIHKLLSKEIVDDSVIGACLKVSDGPLELPHLRRLASHPRWHVRMLAATALGRLGGSEDCRLLLGLLADREWWVRYRAAQALVGLPFLDQQQLEVMRDKITDPFGRDMFDQVLAEAAVA